MKKFQPDNHINILIDDPHYEQLIRLRNEVAITADNYFQSKGAPRVDLYMVTGSVSSPMGKGSDSEPWPIRMGEIDTHLVDSAQFGMEPLVQKSFNMVYCYLPSFRGEDPDHHHLNQFYHCEAELKGSLEDSIVVVEELFGDFFKLLDKDLVSELIEEDRLKLLREVSKNPIQRLNFEEAVKILENKDEYVEVTPHGRKITRAGEIELSKRLYNHKSAFWLTNFDRDIVPFYQKPNPQNTEQVLNADLILPPVGEHGFAGEVLGSGQRQDSEKEMMESIERQAVVNPESYAWYIEMRNRPDYVPTSGFGLGVERLISWMIGTDDIASAAIYPVMNTIKSIY